MVTDNTARKGGMVKYVIFLIAYVFLSKIMSPILHIPNYQPTIYILLGIAGLILSSQDIKEAGKLWKAHPFKNILLVIGAFLLIQIIDNLLLIPYAFLYADQGSSMNEQNIENVLHVANPVIFILGAGILGPIAEETVFRYILVWKSGAKISKIVTVAVSSLLFGMIHMHAFTLSEFLSILPHIGFGVILSILLIKKRNITHCYALHILVNLPSVIMMLLR